MGSYYCYHTDSLQLASLAIWHFFTRQQMALFNLKIKDAEGYWTSFHVFLMSSPPINIISNKKNIKADM